MSDGIVPLNLAARLNQAAVGNPESATLASGVANCYPGLEFDHRNLDRRFFPGLVVEFDDPPDGQPSFGAVVIGVDLDDPMLADLPPDAAGLGDQLEELRNSLRRDQSWWVGAVGQAGVTIDHDSLRGVPLGSSGTWRLVRSLEPGPVTLVLRRYRRGDPVGEMTLFGARRPYLGADEAIDGAYPAGELTQSLCSPWQHDFRDCGCYYWASNHPDIALEPAPEAEPHLPPPPGTGWVNWLRAVPDRPEAPELGYYEISERFQELAVVLRDRESDRPYTPAAAADAVPYGSPEELVAVLAGELAPLEHVLILEYLYAWSSVRTPEEVGALADDELADVLPVAFRADPDAPLDGVTDRAAAADYLRRRLTRDVIFLREQLRATAISEMRHLWWVNLLLRTLAEDGLGPAYRPALGVAAEVPTGTAGETRPRALRPLVREAVRDFEGVEQPSGGLEGRYARVRATLLVPPYRGELFDIASRIVDEGVDHFSSFRRMAMIVDVYDQSPPPHLRPGFTLAPADDPVVAPALDAQRRIVQLLSEGYAGAGDEAKIGDARRAMLDDLEGALQSSAASGRGVPLFAFLDGG
jgi:hypothetical protein